jgi:intraflagellar transport protein 74
MDAAERRDDTDQQKYEILFAKDQEMTTFIESFDDHKAEEQKRMKEKQDSITRSLENISKGLSLSSGGVGLDGHLRDMEDELDFKTKQLQNSESTQSRLEAELSKRQGEVEKIEHLDMKISVELEQTAAKTQQYEDEIANKFDRLDQMTSEGSNRLQWLEARKKQLEGRNFALRQQVGFLKLKYESRRQQLTDDSAAANLESQEQKIRQFGQNRHLLRSNIKQKTEETGCEQEHATCFDIAGQLNKILMEQRPVQFG